MFCSIIDILRRASERTEALSELSIGEVQDFCLSSMIPVRFPLGEKKVHYQALVCKAPLHVFLQSLKWSAATDLSQTLSAVRQGEEVVLTTLL